MASQRYSITDTRACCSLCGADAVLLGAEGVLTVPVEVFDHVAAETDGAPTLARNVCGHCIEEIAATHAALVDELQAYASAAE